MCEFCKAKDEGDSSFEHLMEAIDRYGVVVIAQGGMVFTLGRAKLGQPDFMMALNSEKTMRWICNAVHEYGEDHGIEAGLIHGVISYVGGHDAPICIRAVSESEFPEDGLEFYEMRPELAVTKPSWVQILVPDANGKFPFDAGYDVKYSQHMFKGMQHA